MNAAFINVLKPFYLGKIRLLTTQLKLQEGYLRSMAKHYVSCADLNCTQEPEKSIYQVASEESRRLGCDAKPIEFKIRFKPQELVRLAETLQRFDVDLSAVHFPSFLAQVYPKLKSEAASGRNLQWLVDSHDNCGNTGVVGIILSCYPRDWNAFFFDRDCKVESKSLSKLFTDSGDRDCKHDSECEIYDLSGCGCQSSSFRPIVRSLKHKEAYIEMLSFYKNIMGSQLCFADNRPENCKKKACIAGTCSLVEN